MEDPEGDGVPETMWVCYELYGTPNPEVYHLPDFGAMSIYLGKL